MLQALRSTAGPPDSRGTGIHAPAANNSREPATPRFKAGLRIKDPLSLKRRLNGTWVLTNYHAACMDAEHASQLHSNSVVFVLPLQDSQFERPPQRFFG